MSSDEVIGVLRSCYNSINGRSTVTYQGHELILLAQEGVFLELAFLISEEICKLDPVDSPDPPARGGDTRQHVVDLVKKRGYLLPFTCSPKALESTQNRQAVLYQLLVDLETVRLMTGQQLRDELSIAVDHSLFMREVEPMVHALARATKAKQGGDPVDLVRSIASGTLTPAQNTDLLLPTWELSDKQVQAVNDLVATLNKEYSVRREVLMRRLDVTIQAFLKSQKAEKQMEDVTKIIARVTDWRDNLADAHVSIWSALAADRGLLRHEKISSRFAVKSAVKGVIIGGVPDRGGVLEGYTVDDIYKDVVKANVQLAQKDTGGGKGKGAAMAAAVKKNREAMDGPGHGC
mmetsp:Transcript_33228/g.86090  ORF Transcript_33228/g.86090 Transcript_33228/m.86090 type:complete len:348 (+) Transcript_33228:72-1115(+)